MGVKSEAARQAWQSSESLKPFIEAKSKDNPSGKRNPFSKRSVRQSVTAPSQTQQGMGMVPTPQAPPEVALPQAAESKPLPGMEATPILDQTGYNVFGRRPMPFRKLPKFMDRIGGGPGDGTGQGRMSGPMNPTNIF